MGGVINYYYNIVNTRVSWKIEIGFQQVLQQWFSNLVSPYMHMGSQEIVKVKAFFCILEINLGH